MLKFIHKTKEIGSNDACLSQSKEEGTSGVLALSDNKTEKVIALSPTLLTNEAGSAKLGKVLRLAKRGLPLFPLVPQTKIPFKDFGWKELATSDELQLADWFAQFPGCNWAARTGHESNVFVLDVDGEVGRMSLNEILSEGCTLPATLTTLTGKLFGIHYWFQYPSKGLSLANSAGKIARGLDLRGADGYIVVPPSVHPNGADYVFYEEDADILPAPDWLLELIADSSLARIRSEVLEPEALIPVGRRDDTLFRDASAMRRRGATEQEILAYLKQANLRCEKALPQPQLVKIARSAARYEAALAHAGENISLSRSALHGVAGTIVDAIIPHTEADETALLLHLLAAYGNIIGRHAHCSVDGAQHYTNLFFACVGATAKGRKGTAWNRVRGIVELGDPGWAKKRIQTGLSSGEGLIAAAARQGEADSGTGTAVPDGRLFIVEPELASVLRRMRRDGNTLSATLRNAWDMGSFQVMVKRDPVKVEDAHISIVGHITAEELRRCLTETDLANGFANRFLWVRSTRSKCLPEGGCLTEEQRTVLANLIKPALEFGRQAGLIQRDEEAKKMWAAIYPDLSEGHEGLIGAVTSRAEAQVLRLSLVYALLDCSNEIQLAHLEAALAVWKYCQSTAEWIFTDSLGDSTTDEILSVLRARSDGMTQNKLMNHFQRHKPSGDLRRALGQLESDGYIRHTFQKTAGRKARIWMANGLEEQDTEPDDEEEQRTSASPHDVTDCT